ncbi:SDR family NAD(P)-dependent oxidoreductase [Brevibacillus sp. NRS-1366]|uniref:SDR family NAD(P)-dependent oxidoreductase n=1 Tax=Brevibacillus sp. NRS-1366 TaxID=3233899 RepID=UPI003D1D6EF9
MAQKALVVGASGMLTEVARWLAKQGYEVTVVGRNRGKLEEVRDGSSHPESFTLLALDYHQSDYLREAMEQLVAKQGHIQLVVSWIHQTAPEVLPTIGEVLSRPQKEWNLYHVCGSRAWRNPPVVPEGIGCTYHRIILGFVCGEKESRWLTNGEIAQGVIQAIQAAEPQFIVGSVEPWERRPSY